MEEEIFYPAARKALEETNEETHLIDEAWEEHHVVKLLAAELKKMRDSGERYDAKFAVLAESVGVQPQGKNTEKDKTESQWRRAG